MVTTPINIERLREELAQHPDQDFVSYLCEGLTYGFDTMVTQTELTTKECKNLQSAIRDPVTVKKLINSEIQKGFLCGPFKKLPFEQYRVSPIGVAYGKYSG